jgi:sugar phosphate isomerase/epimerase
MENTLSHFITRREAIRTLGVAAAISCFATPSRGADSKAAWKTAIGLNGFLSAASKYKKSFPLWEILDFASTWKFEGVELVNLWPAQGDYPRSDETDRIRALRRQYELYGLQVFSIQNFVADAFDPDAAVRRRWVDQFADRAKFAKEVGCSCMGIWPGGPLRGQSIDQALDHLAGSLHEAGRIAADQGLITAFEIEPPFVFNKAEHLLRIHRQADHPSLKVIYDPSHFDLMNGSTGRPHELLERVGVKNIGYVQLCDTDGTLRDGGTSKHLPCGDGHANVPVSLKMLKDGGFAGWIMIDAWEIPDPYDACVKGKKMIEAAR